MIKAAAIDDEPLALGVLSAFCDRCEHIQLIKTFTRPSEGLKYLNNYPVDLVFLDIQMPSMMGTELVKQLKQEVMVVFTTAYENFAIEGFNLNAIDYLLKPFSYERFRQAVEKAGKYKNLGSSRQQVPYITVRADYSLKRIELDRIRYIEGLDDYLKIHIDGAKAVVARLTMKTILDQLPPKDFVRIHRSYIVPKARVVAIKNKSVYVGELQLPVGSKFEEALKGMFDRE